jgi:hypothetical protein
MFSSDGLGPVVDPLLTLHFAKSDQGAGLTTVRPQFHRYMAEVLSKRGMASDEIQARSQLQLVDAGSDLFVPYALFAMLVSPDLGGIIPTETTTFLPKEMKTARKFGKSWIIGAPKSHLTIRIGPQAAEHMRERLARLEFEREARENRNSPIHGTQKPVECMRRPILNNSCPGQAVYEPFSGSGSTIIAAETTGRACYAVELDPAYVDVAVRRWEAFTGQEAVLEGQGATFAEVASERIEGET